MNWVNESVFYHIYPLGLCGAPKENNEKEPVPRIEKVAEWIPHLKRLHVNAIYIGPLFESTSHGYDTRDYFRIDTRLGTNDDFTKLCRQLHENGIRVVLDGVFNHVGRQFWAFEDVQEKLQNSRYCGWFHNLNFGGSSPCGDPFWYEGWNGHHNLVKLNMRNPEVVDHLLNAVGMWMDTFGIDGLRLDAADCIDPEFFRRLRGFCKSKNPDFWLMGEIIHGDYNRWANPEQLDSVTNYECQKGLYSSHNTKNYFEIAYSLNRQFGQNGGIYKNICLYNFVDNHDVNRLASLLTSPAHLKNTYTILYTMPGVPSVYYGSEWGVKGTHHDNSDDDLRPCLDLGKIEGADEELCAYIAQLGHIRLSLPALQYGVYEQTLVKNEQYVFCRAAGESRVYVALNLADNPEYIEFHVARPGAYTDLLTNSVYETNDGNMKLELPAHGARILSTDGPLPAEAQVTEPIPETAAPEAPAPQSRPEAVPAPQSVASAPASPAVKQEAAPVQALALENVIPGIYRHYKGELYEVSGVAIHSETQEKLVVYRAMYGEFGLWVRPLSMFLETVEVKGEKMPRFTLVKKFS